MMRLPILRAVKTILALLLLLGAASLFADSELQGLASWYGGKFHGRLTSSGEVFDTNDLTAAHRTLPFGARVKVTNLDNGKSVIVKINDRGPFVEPRIIDLSRAAAEEIAMIDTGVARVSLEIVDFASDRELYAVQVGAYGLAAERGEGARPPGSGGVRRHPREDDPGHHPCLGAGNNRQGPARVPQEDRGPGILPLSREEGKDRGTTHQRQRRDRPRGPGAHATLMSRCERESGFPRKSIRMLFTV